ncbi:MAG: D-glycero-beta-D-manno-heptose 1-phosphate adenylyltransferase [Desulfobacteraceae bacterium]|nr:D-glycero-beta-D-manno-heptose 1-phosphate adenylyltransferase [Desulfobacteraceae bacterium]
MNFLDKEKVISFDRVKAVIKEEKAQNKKIVFTNGCFDILHAGHVSYLKSARSFGDFLILGLNSDESIKKIKGINRPVVEQNQRAIVLSALTCIDCIVIFDQADPEILIKEVLPDVLVKGADWEESNIIGADFVKKNNGVIKRIEFKQDISTTKIIKKIGKLFYGSK